MSADAIVKNLKKNRHFEKSQKCHMSATVWQTATNSSTVTHTDPLDHTDGQKFAILKIRDDSNRHYDKKI